MKKVRSLLSVLSLSVLVSACAHGGIGNTTPSDPSNNTLSLVSMAEPAPAQDPVTVLAPMIVSNQGSDAWSNLWDGARAGQDGSR